MCSAAPPPFQRTVRKRPAAELRPAHRRTGAADLLGPLWSASYDADGNRVAETDGNGQVSHHSYDALKRKTASRLPEGRELRYGYDAAGNLTAETDANGNSTRHGYDALNRRTRTEDALGVKWSGTYDGVGNLESETDGEGQTVRHRHDAARRRTESADALGVKWSGTYDGEGNLISEADGNGRITEYGYTAMNWRRSETRAGVVLRWYVYDETGNLASEVDGNGQATGYEYDGRNLRTVTNGPLAAIRKTVYDAMGDAQSETDPENRKTTRGYDLRRRLRTERNGAGETTTTEYDGNGRVVAVTRPLGNGSTRRYDGAGRLVEVASAAGRAHLEYDPQGNLTARQDATGRRTTYTYDARHRRTGTTHADGARESIVYDGNGRPRTLTDARGHVISYTHDARGRQTRKAYPAGSPDGLASIATTWDGHGNRTGTRIEDGGGVRTHAWVYDAFDRVVAQTDPWGQTVSHGYDAAGNRTSTTAQGVTTRYSHDALNRRTGLMAPGGAIGFSHDRSRLPTAITYPDGSETRTTYDGAGRITGIEHTLGGVLVGRSRFAYDGNGNRTAETQSGPEGERSLGWSYDADDRLVEETLADAGGSRHRVWTLDGAGNRLAEARSGTGAYAGSGSRTDTLNARQQVVGREETGGPSPGRTEYEYDADGQRTVGRGPGGTWHYTWNVRGQLVAVERDGRLVGAYRYDADGQREEKATAAGTRRSLWLEGFAGIDTDEGGRGAGRYEAGPDGRTPVVAMTAAAREYLHADALGSVTLSTGGGGVVGRTAYGAWGEAETTGASGSKFGYTGHQADAETGLIYFKARYYDPGLGAFVSPDRLEGQATVPASWGQYRYANGNPFVYVDRDGNESVCYTNMGSCGGDRGADYDARRAAERAALRQERREVDWHEVARKQTQEQREREAGKVRERERGAQLTAETEGLETGARPAKGEPAEGDESEGRRRLKSAHEAGTAFAEGGAAALAGVFEVLKPSAEAVVLGPAIGGVIKKVGGAKAAAKTLRDVLTPKAKAGEQAAVKELEERAGRVAEGGARAQGAADAARGSQSLGAALNRTITFSEKQLQKKYGSHAGDFGITRTWAKGAADEFEGALRAHVADPGTRAIFGTYRGTQEVTHFFNPQTGLNVIRDADGAFLSGWRLGTDQAKNLLLHGNVQ